MEYIVINTENNISNVSCQIGDIVYKSSRYLNPWGNYWMTGNYQKVGKIVHFLPNPNNPIGPWIGVIVEVEGTVPASDIAPDPGDVLAFSKDNRVNSTNLLGHYLKVQFKTDGGDESNMFSVGSEVSISSK